MIYLKWLKWAWIVTLFATIAYSTYIYIDDGLSWMIVTLLAIEVSAGPSVFYKNTRNSFRVWNLMLEKK
tara:strand:+ start:329 stop:535 length:207 start_codon:yes stop_codon:yes gene_type:complete